MKKTLKLKTLVLSLALAGAASVAMVPAAAQAGVAYNASVSNMYLWRGINISNPSPVVSGGVDYDFGNGFAVGAWTASEGSFDNSSELDLYGSYSFSLGDVDMSVGYNSYLYPYASKAMFKFSSDGGSMLGDYVLGLGYGDFSATAFINAEGKDSGNNIYTSLDYGLGDFGVHLGVNTNDDAAAEYKDYNVSYAATENLSFVLSVADGDGANAIIAGLGGPTEAADNPQLQVSYGFTF